ncbi:MAG: FecR domain-containing protein, partial [Spirochaetales bacterium]|nr:FecR domain-containing protein [Spirochaetales bacterium]
VDTGVEILLNDTGTVIKVAENTTITITSIQDAGGVFEVSYGRVRARVERLTQETPFWLGSGDTVAGVRGTDFGYDLFYDAEAPEKKNIRVYCFEGAVEVVRRMNVPEGETFVPDEDFSTGKEYSSTVILRKNEMVSVDSEKPENLKKERVEPDIRNFWETNEFIFEPEETKAEFIFESFHNDARELRQAGIFTTMGGALIVGGAAAFYYIGDSQGLAVGLTTVGGTMIITGGYFLIRSFILGQ